MVNNMLLKRKVLMLPLAGLLSLGLLFEVTPAAKASSFSQSPLLSCSCGDECHRCHEFLSPVAKNNPTTVFAMPGPIIWKCWLGCPLR